MSAPAVAFAFEVTRYAPRKRHGGLRAHGCDVWEFDTNGRPVGRFETFARNFVCTCGEVLIDGDRVLDTDAGVTHVACL